MTDTIYQDGRIYDLLFPGPQRDIPFWINQAAKYGDPIFELACGTGRVTLALAEQGWQVSGLDSSPAMLGEARKKAAERGIEVQMVLADMRDFDLKGRYALIILPANTIGHILSLDDFEACVASVKKHLLPGGRFVIDIFVPSMELLLDKPGERFPFSEYDDPDGRGRVVVTHSYVYEPDTQIKRITTFHPVPAEEREVEGHLIVRMYFPQELDALLKYNGFTIEHKFGSYDETPFGRESEKQLIVCSVTR